jgi:hypothetical protein
LYPFIIKILSRDEFSTTGREFIQAVLLKVAFIRTAGRTEIWLFGIFKMASKKYPRHGIP